MAWEKVTQPVSILVAPAKKIMYWADCQEPLSKISLVAKMACFEKGKVEVIMATNRKVPVYGFPQPGMHERRVWF